MPVPTLSVTGTVATISDVTSGDDIALLVTKQGASLWTGAGTRLGNGTIDFAVLSLSNGDYTARAMDLTAPGAVSAADDFTVNNAINLDFPDPNWDRWIFASICQHFDDRKDTLTMYVEGTHRDTNTLEEFFELRSDGPQVTQLGATHWRLYVEINTLAQVAKNNTDFHRLRRMTGTLSRAYTNCISVYKYGSAVGDDQTLLGVLVRKDDLGKRERVQTSHFGQIDPDVKLEQATIEAHYEMDLFV